MPRFLLTVQYLGTRYAGWQSQANALGVQQVVEKALERLCGAPAAVEASGRTDAGVHARAQQAHVDIAISIQPRGLILGLNDLMPHDIRITAAEVVDPSFHARFGAKEKTYIYQVWNQSVCDVFHHETFAHVPAPLDAATMHEAAQPLVGHHDFRAFTVTEPEVKTTWRTITRIGVERSGDEVRISVSGDGFLRNMVRRIAGSLIEVGKGRITATEVASSIEPHYAVARWTAPANGLVLDHVSYGKRQA